MGSVFTPTTFRKAGSPEELVRRFADIMRRRYCAELYIFGSRARGDAGKHSDYDIVAVSGLFEGVKTTSRVEDRVILWLEAGGWGQALDLHCYTPEEFSMEIADGPGYLGRAMERRELVPVASSGTNLPSLDV